MASAGPTDNADREQQRDVAHAARSGGMQVLTVGGAGIAVGHPRAAGAVLRTGGVRELPGLSGDPGAGDPRWDGRAPAAGCCVTWRRIVPAARRTTSAAPSARGSGSRLIASSAAAAILIRHRGAAGAPHARAGAGDGAANHGAGGRRGRMHGGPGPGQPGGQGDPREFLRAGDRRAALLVGGRTVGRLAWPLAGHAGGRARGRRDGNAAVRDLRGRAGVRTGRAPTGDGGPLAAGVRGASRSRSPRATS